MSRAHNIVLVLCFVTVLAAPTVASILGWNPMGAIDERRKLAKKPDESPWSLRGLSRTSEWEKYFNDHFGLRKLLIGSYRFATFHALGTSPNPAVVVGESDGTSRWLYYDAGVVNDGLGLDAFLGRNPYTAAELTAVGETLKKVSALVREKGAKLIIAVCPDKQTIYPEYLPASKRPRPGHLSRLDQFWAMAATLDSVPLVDVSIPLKQAKADRPLYYPGDTHWNLQGGLVAYLAIARALARQDASRTVLPVENLEWTLGPPRPGDLVRLMGVPGLAGDPDWQPTPASYAALAGPKQGKLLVIFDSFFPAIEYYLGLQFETVKKFYVTHGMREALLIPGLLDAEKPDVVLLQSVERFWTAD